MTAESAGLAAEQRQVLQGIYDWFRRFGIWPAFVEIDRPLRRAGIDPESAIMSMPDGLVMVDPFEDNRAELDRAEVLALTIAGIASCEGGDEDVERFVRLVPWLAQKELALPDGALSAEADSDEVRDFLGLRGETCNAIARIFEILIIEGFADVGDSRGPGDKRSVVFSREASRFRNVKSLSEYLQIQNPGSAKPPDPPGEPNERDPRRDTYVAASVIQILEDKAAQSTWNFDKLFQLISELNDNYASKNTYATHTLLRAILDHVPPILGCHNFNEVASSYHWSRTDTGYIKNLLAFRLQGDDALHRPISEKPDLLRFEDLPSGAGINRLLQKCADKL